MDHGSCCALCGTATFIAACPCHDKEAWLGDHFHAISAAQSVNNQGAMAIVMHWHTSPAVHVSPLTPSTHTSICYFPHILYFSFPLTCTAEPCPLSHLHYALSAGAIAGIVVAGVIVIAALTAAVILVGVVIRRGTQWSCAPNTIKA